MTNRAEDPISRATAALARAQGADMPPALVEVWKEAQAWLLEAAEERRAFMAVAHNAMALVETLDEYEEAIEAGDDTRIAALNEAGAEAEDALVDALNELHTLIAADTDLSADVAYLAAMDRFTDEDEEPRQ